MMDTAATNYNDLCNKLRSMKLSSMADTLELQLADPNSGLKTFGERIGEVITAEWNTRYSKKFNRYLKKATLKYPAADIDDSIYDADRLLDRGRKKSSHHRKHRLRENIYFQCTVYQRAQEVPHG